jgi:hypothetical protein
MKPFITELIQQKPYAQRNKLFAIIESFQRYILAIIESFQRYIPSDKSIILNKGR